jgi:predicted glycoside hydrolase/deacetylase ChbG (UPF0249 family)
MARAGSTDHAGGMDLTSNELLGFPPDARLLIVNCDDFGMHQAINAAVVASIEEGIAVSCSLMPVCPGAADAIRLLRQRPEIPAGIHLTLTCETPGYRWGPLTAREKVPSLLDATGELFAEIGGLLAQARLDEVEVEFRAQIEAVLAAGLSPTHLDWHCLADGGREEIFDLTVALAGEYGLATRVWLEPAHGKTRRRGLPAIDHAFLDSFSLGLDGKQARYARMLRDLPPGLSEWAVHPGLGDAESQAVDPDGWRVRRTDYEFLTSPEARDLLRREEVAVIGYGTVQQAWLKGALADG